MAAGKTTVGKRIASKVNLPFYDSDKVIEYKFNMTVNDIFRKYGEEKFRSIEQEIILDYIHSNHHKGFIMSLGGGSFINESIRSAVLNEGVSVWLNANIEIISLRLNNTKNTRPLLRKINTREKLIKLMNERSEFYNKANIKIDIIKASKDNMATITLQKIYEYVKPNYE